MMRGGLAQSCLIKYQMQATKGSLAADHSLFILFVALPDQRVPGHEAAGESNAAVAGVHYSARRRSPALRHGERNQPVQIHLSGGNSDRQQMVSRYRATAISTVHESRGTPSPLHLKCHTRTHNIGIASP